VARTVSERASSSPVLLHVFPTFAVGGSQVRFAAIANRFGRRFRHVVVALDGRTECRERLAQGLDVDFAAPTLRTRDTLGNAVRFRSFLRSLRPSRLITHNWGSMDCALANWPKLVPHIHIEDGFGPEETICQLPRRVITRRVVLSRSTVVLPSRNLYHLACDAWKLPQSRLRYIPNGIDCARFSAPKITPLPVSGAGPVIGTVAALRPEKNLIRLLDAFRHLRTQMQCRLLVVGDGPERQRLERYAYQIGVGDDAIFTGYMADTERAYAAMTVLALSSDTEQLPTAVLEAMAAGLPVVSTDVGDVAHMVSEHNRPLVVPLTAADLATALLGLFTSPNLGREIGGANRRRVRQDYDQERMFSEYEALYAAPLRLGCPQMQEVGAQA
jgi:glycosyltransferase involved in cell wall biosynthesis